MKGVQESRFMLNKSRSCFVIVKLRRKSLVVIFPVPLFIFSDLLQALCDLAVLWGHVFPRLQLPQLIMDQLAQVFVELRQLGRWTLVEVNDDENQIAISFY